MKTKKMSLASMQGKLSRTEMKNIMAGSGGYLCSTPEYPCKCNGTDKGCKTLSACFASC